MHSESCRVCYQAKLGSTHPMCSKANLLTLGCDEEKFDSLQGQRRRMGSSAHAQKAQTPPQLSGKVVYRQCGEAGGGGSQGLHNSLMGFW